MDCLIKFNREINNRKKCSKLINYNHESGKNYVIRFHDEQSCGKPLSDFIDENNQVLVIELPQ